ncbi:hypothetical protein [Schlesneria paludicola]|nr:hypothetical protein [Schlesneria paludicola]
MITSAGTLCWWDSVPVVRLTKDARDENVSSVEIAGPFLENGETLW